ncbi:putative hydrolase, HD superfamily [Pseudomonas orientalis]|nr:putative hydrolase, HD superfamily [Pseudomonas orientalis]
MRERFDIQIDLPACVNEADMVALATERRDLMPEHPCEWDCLRGVQPMKETIIPFSAESASMMIFSQLMALMQSSHCRRLSA